ncbi:MAG: hypothetical protein V4474_01895 [Patescibacteria group bacterium]
MFAKYDKNADAYLCAGEWVPRVDILNVYKVRFDTGQEILQMVADAYFDAHGREPSASELHAHFMGYMCDERNLPAWICEAYSKARQRL